MNIKTSKGDGECRGCLSYRMPVVYNNSKKGYCTHVAKGRYKEFREICPCKNCLVKTTCPSGRKTSGTISSSDQLFCQYFRDSIKKYLGRIINERKNTSSIFRRG